jgi:phosphate transport system protein
MTTHHDHELSQLKDKLLTMASLAEQALVGAVRALVDHDDDLAVQVKANDDAIDRLEIAVDDAAVGLLAKAPLARDLRFIVVAMKISHDLERAGDEACGVAKQALKLNAEPQLKPYVDIPNMATMAQQMLREAIAAFIDGDAQRARAVLPSDQHVNTMHKQLQRELISYMLEAPPNITRCLSLMQVAKRIERIADHAKNIAEEVVFLLEGRDIRHKRAMSVTE